MRMFLTCAALTLFAYTPSALAFCGFYVARADTSLFNRASQVVLVRDDDRTVITMANDFEGDVKDFAVVVPVPTFIERGQINVADRAHVEHLDAYTAPRLVEYHDSDPCVKHEYLKSAARNDADLPAFLENKATSKPSRSRFSPNTGSAITVRPEDIVCRRTSSPLPRSATISSGKSETNVSIS